MITPYLRRGLAAGLLAGLLAGIFAFFVGEPLLERAMTLESSGHAHNGEVAAHSHGGEEEIFSRTTQKVGLFFATGLSGTFVGGLFGMAFAFMRDLLSSDTDWGRSLSLAAAAFAGAVFLPFLKYPANPPTVGDPSTIGSRTIAYFVMVGVSLLTILVCWHAARRMRESGVVDPIRHLTVGAALVTVFGLLFVGLPATADPGEFPAGLLWSFRLSSIGTQVVLWTGLGVVFGLLCERANGRDEQREEAA